MVNVYIVHVLIYIIILLSLYANIDHVPCIILEMIIL